MFADFRQAWRRSQGFRLLLIVVTLYTLLRILVQAVLIAQLFYPGAGETFIPVDLQIYLEAAQGLLNQQDLYLTGQLDTVEFFQYTPLYALAFGPFLLLPASVVALLFTLLHFVAYTWLYVRWHRIFKLLELEHAREMLIWTLPAWLVFSSFWGELGYLNIYIIMALLATFFIEAILFEQFGWSLLWLSIILHLKPQWAFAAAVPLLLGRYRFWLKLVVFTPLIYLGLMGVVMAWTSPAYGWKQYQDYFAFLIHLPANFPWRGPEAGFLGYNHSVTQIVVYLFGSTEASFQLAMGLKVLLLAPLGAVCLAYFYRPFRSRETVVIGLELAFGLYLGAFIWLDMVWELSLGIVVFTYLMALESRTLQVGLMLAFLPYALLDFWQLLSFALFGEAVILPGFYIATDPGIYVPLIMIVILVFYAVLLHRLWFFQKTWLVPEKQILGV